MTDVADTLVESLVGDTRKVSITFEHKLAVPNSYGHTVARAWVEDTVPVGATDVEVHLRLQELFNTVGAAVFTQLGVEYDYDPENNVVRPKTPEPTMQVQFAQAFQGSTEVTSAESSAPSGGVRVMNPGWNGPALPEWLVNDCLKSGVTKVYDNRLTATGNQPLFKEAVGRGEQGHGQDGKQKGFWPPK